MSADDRLIEIGLFLDECGIPAFTPPKDFECPLAYTTLERIKMLAKNTSNVAAQENIDYLCKTINELTQKMRQIINGLESVGCAVGFNGEEHFVINSYKPASVDDTKLGPDLSPSETLTERTFTAPIDNEPDPWLRIKKQWARIGVLESQLKAGVAKIRNQKIEIARLQDKERGGQHD